VINTYIARFETPNFTFEGVGGNEFYARLALVRAWNEHADSREGVDRDYIVEFWDDIRILRYVHNRGYRDGEQIAEALPPGVLDTRRIKEGESVYVVPEYARVLWHGHAMGHRDGGPQTGLVDVRMDHDGRVHTVDTKSVL